MHETHRFAWLRLGGAECALCGAYWLDHEAFLPCVVTYTIVLNMMRQEVILPPAISAAGFQRLAQLNAW